MSAGSVVSTIVFVLLTFTASLLIFRFYARVSSRKMPVACRMFIIIATCAAILPFPFLIVDINAAFDAKSDANMQNEWWMIGLWYAIMAVTYIMGWGILPISQLYTEVGEFTPRKKIIHAIKSEAKFYAIFLAILVVFFGYIVFLKGAYDSFGSVLRLAISLVNAWGLILLLLFMSSGLVGVPKVLWRNSDEASVLRSLYYSAVDIQEDLDLAAMDLAAIKAELMMIDPILSEEHRPYWTHMMEEIACADRDIPQYHSASARVKPVSDTNHTDVSLKHLEDLHERVKYSIKIAERMNYRWDSTVRRCNFLDELIRGVQVTTNPLKRVWFMLRGIVYKGAAVCSAILTLLVLWSEFVMPFQSLTTTRLSVIELVMYSNFQLVGSMIFLFYMAYCAYWSIMQLRIFDMYVMIPAISDNASICFSTTFLSRLIMPLCFNFLLISGLSTDIIDVMYGHVYRRNMDVSLLLGAWLNRFVPIFIPIVSLLVLAKVSDRLLRLIGVDVDNPDNINSRAVQQRIEDGHRLVAHALGQPLTALDLSSVGLTMDSPGAQAVPDQLQERQGAVRGQRYREYLARRAAEGNDGNEREPV